MHITAETKVVGNHISRKYLWIIETIVPFIIFTIFIFVLRRYSRKIKIKVETFFEGLRGFLERYMRSRIREEMIKTLKEKNLLVGRNFLYLREKLGKGNFGIIYKALMHNENEEIEVAVKTVKSGKQCYI
jgi:hypothetical protein